MHRNPKVIERILGYYCSVYFEGTNAYGHNQFAYMRNRRYRDCLAYNVCCQLKTFHDNKKVGLYCSDVAGAFGRVCNKRLLKKLKAKCTSRNLEEIEVTVDISNPPE